MSENFQAWEWWNQISMRDRPIDGMSGAVLYLPRLLISQICEMNDLANDDFDKILILDEIFVKSWRNKQSEKREEQKRKSYGRQKRK